MLREVSSGGWEPVPGGLAEQVGEGTALGLEAAPLGVGEAGGRQVEVAQVEQRSTHALEALLEVGGEAADGRAAVQLGAQGGQGVAQEVAALALGVGGTEGGDEGQGLALREAVPQHAGEQRLLVLGADGGQGVAERGADASLVEPGSRGLAEARGQGVATGDPGLAAAEQAGDGGEGEAVVAHERVDDARLVHGAEGAGRRVGAQEQGLALERRAGPLDDDGDCGGACLGPARQALEAVDDLEGAVLARDDAEGQLGEAGGRLGAARARAQGGQARAQPLDVHAQDARLGARRRRHGRGAHG